MESSLKGLCHVILISLVVIFGILVISYMASTPIWETLLGDVPVLGQYHNHSKLSQAEIEQLNGLLKKGVIANPDGVTSALVSFYETLIVVLVSLLSLMSVFAYFSIRSLSKRDAEIQVYDSVERYFKSDTYDIKLEESMAPIKEKLLRMGEELEAKNNEFIKIKNDIEKIISESDRDEESEDANIEP